MITLKLSDKNNNFIADRINNINSLICMYIIFGWLSKYHSHILVFLIPSIYIYWLLYDNKCLLTTLENHFRIADKDKDKDKDKGFIETKLENLNINISNTKLDKLIIFISYFSFILSYYNSDNICHL